MFMIPCILFLCISNYAMFVRLPLTTFQPINNVSKMPALVNVRYTSKLSKKDYLANYHSPHSMVNAFNSYTDNRALHIAVECLLQDIVNHLNTQSPEKIKLYNNPCIVRRARTINLLLEYGANPLFTNRKKENVWDYILNYTSDSLDKKMQPQFYEIKYDLIEYIVKKINNIYPEE